VLKAILPSFIPELFESQVVKISLNSNLIFAYIWGKEINKKKNPASCQFKCMNKFGCLQLYLIDFNEKLFFTSFISGKDS